MHLILLIIVCISNCCVYSTNNLVPLHSLLITYCILLVFTYLFYLHHHFQLFIYYFLIKYLFFKVNPFGIVCIQISLLTIFLVLLHYLFCILFGIQVLFILLLLFLIYPIYLNFILFILLYFGFQFCYPYININKK